MENDTIFYKIIDEICKEKNINQKMLSYDWIRQLKKDDKIRNLIWYQFDLNTSNSVKIAGDKYATFELLSKNNIPIIEHKMIFNPETREKYYNKIQIEDALSLLEKYGRVIIKANQSAKGKHVVLCYTEKEVLDTINKMINDENKDTLSACPYVDIDYEYRAVYLLGEVLYIYKKQKPFIIGDGIKPVKKLIEEKFSDVSNFSFNNDINFDEVLECGEKLVVSWKHNLCNGAEPIVIDERDNYYNKVKEIAEKSAKTININFATIDIALTSDKKLEVMEINASVCMDRFAVLVPNGYEIVKKIYSKAIDSMFNY